MHTYEHILSREKTNVGISIQPLDPHNYVEQVVPKTLQEELISKGFLNFLPDHDVVHARMMLHAWEQDLEGVEDDACNLIIEATYVILDLLFLLLNRSFLLFNF